MTTTNQPGSTKQRASQSAGTAAEQGQHVAGVAKGEAQNVANEAKHHARGLVDEARGQVDEQSRTQRDRLVGTLSSFSDDLEKMADNSQTPGMASDLVRQVADRARDLGQHLDGREPAQILDDVRGFARRRPGTFLLGALAAGVVAGRVTRGARDARSEDSGASAPGAEYAGSVGSPYDEPRGTATGTPTAGTPRPDGPLAAPAAGTEEAAPTRGSDVHPNTTQGGQGGTL